MNKIPEISPDVMKQALRQIRKERNDKIKAIITKPLEPLKKLAVDHKYVKTGSLTWWTAITPLVGGLSLIFENTIPGASYVADITRVLTDMDAKHLIWLGLGGIGLRGAIK